MASFLTRGGCYISWERGAEVFEEWLLDHEAACNIGNWQWLSCTAFYAMFYRVYSPVAFPQKWDKPGAFVRRYVPELKNYPEKFIYEPWKAPLATQRQAGCLVTDEPGEVDGAMKIYPTPIFDFAQRRTACMAGMKDAYAKGIYGDDKRVLDGSARALFPPPEESDQAAKGGDEGAREEDEGAAADDGDGDKGGDVKEAGKANQKGKGKGKREKGQATLDGVVKRAKTRAK